ncbi:MAG TPA: hypothetical protein VMK12_31390 [Anaeromyxobacteraceae bacterium]|nr:hypothetical protein [Anaeromyxobacteraceae bacterium]
MLKLLLLKGVITQAEYDSALSGKIPPSPTTPPLAFVRSKFETELYGFMELDTILDSTQSFNEPAGNAAIAEPQTYAGRHGRLMISDRHSRLGLKIAAADFHGVKASALVEVDFLGNQPSTVTEFAFFSYGTLRMRHFLVKLETPVVDVLLGQWWALFGWQNLFFPSSLQVQGMPGQLFQRIVQLRLSHLFKSDPVSLEIAAAAVRPPQRDSWAPDGQAGLRLLVNRRRGVRTIAATLTQVDALAVGVSGTVRRFSVPQFSATPTSNVATAGWGIAVDSLIPLLSGSLEARSNALTFTGSFMRGAGIADLYTGFAGGGLVTFPPLPNPTGASPAPTYTSGVDNGLVTFGPDGRLHPVGWQGFILGLQYYLPPAGRLWLTGVYSQMHMTNAGTLGVASTVYTKSSFLSADLFWDATPALRFGAGYAWFRQQYARGSIARNSRFQFSTYYLF